MEIRENERIDFLFDKDLRIVQSHDVFSFSLDAVLLAKFVYVPIQKGQLVDLCSGNGAIPLMLSKRTKGTITAVEIQEKLHDMAQRSVRLNRREDRIHLIHGDIEDMPGQLGYSKFDVVTCNPPYFATPAKSDKNSNPHLAIARHEIHTTLKKVVDVSRLLAKQGGKAAFVHRPERLPDLMLLMRSKGLEPKRLQLVYPKKGKEANMVLIEGAKDGKPGLTVLPPLTVYNENNQYTEELKDVVYGK